MIFVVYLRHNANPDYKLLSPDTIKYLKKKLPHKGEI